MQHIANFQQNNPQSNNNQSNNNGNNHNNKTILDPTTINLKTSKRQRRQSQQQNNLQSNNNQSNNNKTTTETTTTTFNPTTIGERSTYPEKILNPTHRPCRTFFHLGFWEGGQSSRFWCARSSIGRKKNCKRVELEIIGVLFTFSENYQDCQKLQSIWRSVPENSNLSKISKQGSVKFTFFSLIVYHIKGNLVFISLVDFYNDNDNDNSLPDNVLE